MIFGTDITLVFKCASSAAIAATDMIVDSSLWIPEHQDPKRQDVPGLRSRLLAHDEKVDWQTKNKSASVSLIARQRSNSLWQLQLPSTVTIYHPNTSHIEVHMRRKAAHTWCQQLRRWEP